MKKNLKSNKGFTLVEILGVIIILAFLAFIVSEVPKEAGVYYYVEYNQLKEKNLINDEMLPSIEYVNTLKTMYVKIGFNGNNYTYTLVNNK